MKQKHLILTLLALFASFDASAYSFEVDGIFYDYMYNAENTVEVTYGKYQYLQDDEELIEWANNNGYHIYRDPDMDDFVHNIDFQTNTPAYSGDIIIPSSVTYEGRTYTVKRIGNNAFDNCYGITSISIPYSITDIGYDAFYGCRGLTSVNIPNSVEYILRSAFQNCTGLTSIIIPQSVVGIDEAAFSGCTALTSVTVFKETPPGVHSNTFSGCYNATLYVPYGCIAAYEASSFWNYFTNKKECISFTDPAVGELCLANWDTNSNGNLSLEEAAAVTSLGTVFEGNMSITSFNELQHFTGLTEIDDYAFEDATSLTSVIIPQNVKRIGIHAFANGFVNSNVSSNLTTVQLPEGLTDIDNYAFYGCNSLASVTIPNSVTSIGNYAFYKCNSIRSVNIPNNVTSIGYNTFQSCSSLTNITIPNSLTSIGIWAFENCSSLTSVVSKIQKPFALSSGSNVFSNISLSCVLTVPIGTRDAYIAAGWGGGNFKGGIVEEAFDETITVGPSSYATFCSPYALDFSNVTDLKAYIASGFSPSTGKLVLTRVDEVPAGEGLYLVGDPGTYEVPSTTTDMMYSNLLKGVTTATTIYPTEGDYTNFILANGIHGIGFYTLSTSGELAAGKAYLQLPTASVSNVKAISVIFDDDDPTAIQDIEDYTTAESIYNLQGQKVNQPKQGLYIVNGKKVLFK